MLVHGIMTNNGHPIRVHMFANACLPHSKFHGNLKCFWYTSENTQTPSLCLETRTIVVNSQFPSGHFEHSNAQIYEYKTNFLFYKKEGWGPHFSFNCFSVPFLSSASLKRDCNTEWQDSLRVPGGSFLPCTHPAGHTAAWWLPSGCV